MEEKNKEFEKKMEMNQLLIDFLMRKNVKKEALLEDQKGKSSSHRAKILECKKSFQEIKDALVSSNNFFYFKFDMKFKVHTTVSDFTIEGVLIQEGRSMTFKSKKLSGSQLRWPIHKQELFAVVYCLKA